MVAASAIVPGSTSIPGRSCALTLPRLGLLALLVAGASLGLITLRPGREGGRWSKRQQFCRLSRPGRVTVEVLKGKRRARGDCRVRVTVRSGRAKLTSVLGVAQALAAAVRDHGR